MSSRAQSPTRGRTARRRLAAASVTALAAALFAGTALVAEPVRVPTASMEPTVRAGDQVLLYKPGRADPHRGDLVVFHAGDGSMLLKRVAAVAGQQVGIEDGVLVVDGRPIREPYVRASEVDGLYYGPVRVPAGHVFVLGDNRADSTDSRAFGPVPVSRIAGRVRIRLWPPGRIPEAR